MYVLPNRKAFADSITRIFLNKKYRTEHDQEDKDVDACLNRATGTRELFPYQKLVRDYLLTETPYRGLLLYHGLGSGKTCSSIAVAESLLSKKKIYVLAPKSLLINFNEELRKCGDPIYKKEQYWEIKNISSEEDREKAKKFGITEKFIDSKGRYFITIPDRPSNFSELPLDVQKDISGQIDDIINQRFELIAYNGISSKNIDRLFPPDDPHKFDDSVIIIDEAHNFTGYVLNESVLKTRVYDMIYHAKNAKLVLLSGTPIINNPVEISYLMNLLRGPIERVSIGSSSIVSWDEGMMTAFFKTLKDVDVIEYNSVKRTILLTRNPPYFESILNEKGERIAVKYNKDFEQEPDILKWVDTWRKKFQDKIPGIELLPIEKLQKEELECLPTKFEDFANLFIDGLQIKNALLFQRRIQGLVSYFRGADERLVAKENDPDKRLVKIPMSSEQFLRYLEKRKKEIDIDSSRSRNKSDINEDFGSYRTNSRLVCNFALPPELEVVENNESLDKDKIFQEIKKDPKRYVKDSLKNFSPKMAELLKNIKEVIGEYPNFKNQFVYSFFTGIEGTGMFGLVLENNGFQEYKLVQEQGVYIEDPSMKPGVPAFAFFTGDEPETEREYYRQIFNNKFSDTFPATLKESIKEPGRLCILMASKSGAEGINLENVRNVHIMESQWNPAISNQVVGRAIRICSHARLPMKDRVVDVKFYVSVFSQDQQSTIEGPNIALIRRNDTMLKRYDVDTPVEMFMSTDEYLYDLSYRKGRIAKNISHLLKQSAVDCEIHRKLHSKEEPVIQCMRFDTTTKPEDLAYESGFKSEERDTLYLQNIDRKKRRLQRISVKGLIMILDPDTNEIFDGRAFEDNHRLLKLGMKKSPTEIHLLNY
jgi:SNF2 family DNA or RNA helicase